MLNFSVRLKFGLKLIFLNRYDLRKKISYKKDNRASYSAFLALLPTLSKPYNLPTSEVHRTVY